MAQLQRAGHFEIADILMEVLQGIVRALTLLPPALDCAVPDEAMYMGTSHPGGPREMK